MHYASVLMLGATCAIMHSKTPIWVPIMPPATFWERLDSYGNCSLWENLSYNGDGEGIRDRLCSGSLSMAHNGSYMAEESPELCLVGVIIFCSSTRQWLKSSVAELSDAASNYHRELLGAVIALLILCATSEGLPQPLPHATLFCYDRGILSNGNSHLTALPKKQKQADIIHLVKFLRSSNNCRATWEWVEGHAVEWKGWQGCTLPK
jgi:hypothetical protein